MVTERLADKSDLLFDLYFQNEVNVPTYIMYSVTMGNVIVGWMSMHECMIR